MENSGDIVWVIGSVVFFVDVFDDRLVLLVGHFQLEDVFFEGSQVSQRLIPVKCFEESAQCTFER